MKRLLVVVRLVTLICAPTIAGEFKETRKGIVRLLTSEKWAATMPLYKTRVYEGGDVVNRPDDESIMRGQRVRIERGVDGWFITVNKNGLVKVRVVHPQRISKFWIHFYFNDRIGENPERELAAFRKMVLLVMEPMPE